MLLLPSFLKSYIAFDWHSYIRPSPILKIKSRSSVLWLRISRKLWKTGQRLTSLFMLEMRYKCQRLQSRRHLYLISSGCLPGRFASTCTASAVELLLFAPVVKSTSNVVYAALSSLQPATHQWCGWWCCCRRLLLLLLLLRRRLLLRELIHEVTNAGSKKSRCSPRTPGTPSDGVRRHLQQPLLWFKRWNVEDDPCQPSYSQKLIRLLERNSFSFRGEKLLGEASIEYYNG